MRVAQVYPGFDIGGISLLMQKTAELLSELGHECKIVTPEGILNTGHVRPEKNDSRFQIYLFKHLVSLIRLIGPLKRLGLDVIHVHSYWMFPFTNLLLLFGHRFAGKVIWTPQLSPQFLGRGEAIARFNVVSRSFLRLYCYYVGPFLARRVDTIVACTASEAKVFRAWGARRVVVIPTPVDEAFFEQMPTRTLGGPLRLLYVGRVSVVKGVDTLIRSVEYLAELHVPFLLHVVGPKHVDFPEDRLIDWPGMVEGENLRNKVVFVGPVYDRRALRDFYLNSNILVFPSKPVQSEAFPSVILEALATGLPIVSTSVGYVSEMIEQGRNGIIIPPDDPEAMAEAILQLASDPERLQQISMYNLEQGKHLMPLSYTRRLLDVYKPANGSSYEAEQAH